MPFRGSFFFCSFVLAVLVLSTAAHAGTLSLSGVDLVWDPASGPSPQFVVSVSNDVATDPPADLLTGWQLLLKIVPTGGATGTLNFASHSVPTGYLLDGNSLGPFPTIGPLDTLVVFDSIDVGGDEVQVPLGPTPLSQFDFSSVSARGLFEVYAFGGPVESNWSDTASSTRYFAGAPNGGSPQLLGTVEVVPEPATWAVAMVGLFGLLSMRAMQSIRGPRGARGNSA